jgi:hypothetical protein
MSALLNNEHEKLIRELNENFSDDELNRAYEIFKSLTYSASFLEVEAWLKQLLVKEKLPIINGILSMLYLGIDDLERAKEHALIVDKNFPDTEIWQNIVNSSIWQRFEEENEECNTH